MSMRSRSFHSMTNAEVTDYLARSNIIFLPVGTLEMYGEMPLGCEHVLPLAVASRLAEAVDGLVLPSLAYFYPGATVVRRGTIQVSPSEGAAYLKVMCRSLLRRENSSGSRQVCCREDAKANAPPGSKCILVPPASRGRFVRLPCRQERRAINGHVRSLPVSSACTTRCRQSFSLPCSSYRAAAGCDCGRRRGRTRPHHPSCRH